MKPLSPLDSLLVHAIVCILLNICSSDTRCRMRRFLSLYALNNRTLKLYTRQVYI